MAMPAIIKYVLLNLFLLCAVVGSVQPITYPTLALTGKKYLDFEPKGWRTLDADKGDLNKDGYDDHVIVFERNTYHTAIENDDTLVYKPRMLAIVFYNKPTGKFNLVAQSNTFILTDDTTNFFIEPFVRARITAGYIYITNILAATRETMQETSTTYKFRYQKNDFALIGAEYKSYHPRSLYYTKRSFNFLTKKWLETTGYEEHGDTPTETWHTLDMPQLKTLKTFTKPYSWEVSKDVYL